MRYRKRPVIIEAFRMTVDAMAQTERWPDWLRAARDKDRNEPGSLQWADREMDLVLRDLGLAPNDAILDQLEIVTLEGSHRLSWGDWIICGVEGELYPCKPNIFAATYETEE